MDEIQNIEAAIQTGNIPELERLAQSESTFPFGVDRHQYPWICYAAVAGTPAAVAWMIAKGVDVNAGIEEHCAPVVEVFERDNPERCQILRILVQHGAALYARGRNHWTPAHFAACEEDLEALEILVKAGADLSLRTIIDNDLTPLEEARSLRRSSKIIDYLEQVSSRC